LFIHGIVKLWNEITQRATIVAEGNSAVHASGGLMRKFSGFKWSNEFSIMFYTLNVASFEGSFLSYSIKPVGLPMLLNAL
jgi:hypothetical protein